ncbi:MAG TPA: type I methionyl aminopeptidase [Verrucomicrobiales bacterium]|nr:type I methionyl aminopeptidase [Verrucomicrobiales bacterium]
MKTRAGQIPIRSGGQLDMLRRAGETASRILGEVAAMIQPGVTTGDVDAEAARLIAKAGCQSAFLGYRKFPGNICISVNEEVVHGIGGPRVIRYGDIVKIDVGVVQDGWVGDNAVTVPVGMIAPETQRLLMTTEEALHLALSYAREGEYLSTLCASVETHVVSKGYSVVREYVGHGVGRKLHEEPQIPNYWEGSSKGPRLREGMVLAVEPMVNQGAPRVRTLEDRWTVVTLDGKPSAHFEHTVVVHKGEPEILTWRERLRL